jgi:hypothetical protein
LENGYHCRRRWQKEPLLPLIEKKSYYMLMKKLKESKPDVPLTGTVVKYSKERLIRKNYTQFYTYLWNPASST